MNLFSDPKSEIDEELNEEAVRISVGLSGRAAEAFRMLHESLGGDRSFRETLSELASLPVC